MGAWSMANVRHLGRLVVPGRRPAVAVYESIGDDLFIAPAPGWLNLGYWEGPGRESEAERACERLVEMLAAPLPRDAVVLDVANGLGAQDLTIRRVAHPKTLIAINITEFQLRAGRERLQHAGALPVNADAMAIPVADASVDGVISVEAAFHFPSRSRFFAEARRVLRPGGVLTMSDISVERLPHTAAELAAGLFHARFWGVRRRMVASAGEIAAAAERAGFRDVRLTLCGQQVIDAAMDAIEQRLERANTMPAIQRWGAGKALNGVRTLRRGGILQYVLLTAVRP